MTKRLLVAGVALALMLTAHSAEARRRHYYYGGNGAMSKTFGLGLVLYDPSGLSAELRLGGRTSLDFAVGVDAFYDHDLYVHVDYLAYIVDLSNGGSVNVPIYLGVGPVFWNHPDPQGDAHFGVRVPIGIAIALKSTPVQFFFEVAPRLIILHEYGDHGRFDITGAIGFRIYF